MPGFGFSLPLVADALIKGVGRTIIRREADGTATVIAFARLISPSVTRQGDGTVIVA